MNTKEQTPRTPETFAESLKRRHDHVVRWWKQDILPHLERAARAYAASRGIRGVSEESTLKQTSGESSSRV
jgi:hypothetical protein